MFKLTVALSVFATNVNTIRLEQKSRGIHMGGMHPMCPGSTTAGTNSHHLDRNSCLCKSTASYPEVPPQCPMGVLNVSDCSCGQLVWSEMGGGMMGGPPTSGPPGCTAGTAGCTPTTGASTTGVSTTGTSTTGASTTGASTTGLAETGQPGCTPATVGTAACPLPTGPPLPPGCTPATMGTAACPLPNGPPLPPGCTPATMGTAACPLPTRPPLPPGCTPATMGTAACPLPNGPPLPPGCTNATAGTAGCPPTSGPPSPLQQCNMLHNLITGTPPVAGTDVTWPQVQKFIEECNTWAAKPPFCPDTATGKADFDKIDTDGSGGISLHECETMVKHAMHS